MGSLMGNAKIDSFVLQNSNIIWPNVMQFLTMYPVESAERGRRTASACPSNFTSLAKEMPLTAARRPVV